MFSIDWLFCRCWVVTDENERMLSQKRAPKLATIVPKVEQTDDGRYTLVVTAPSKGELTISQPDYDTPFTSLRYGMLIHTYIVISVHIQ